MKLRFSGLAMAAIACVVFPRAAHAEDEQGASSSHAPFRIGAAGTGGYGSVHRSSSDPRSEGAMAIGGELRLHPYSPHGVVLGYTYAEGIFGPRVSIVDTAYSLRVAGSRRLDGVTGALYVDIGPSMGFVSHAPPGPDHTVLGARVSLAADLQLWNFTVGPVLAYRGGVPLGGPQDGWEGALTVLARAGIVIDVGR
jgi:hypothetical protein